MALYQHFNPKRRVGLYLASSIQKENKQPVGVMDDPLLTASQLPQSQPAVTPESSQRVLDPLL